MFNAVMATHSNDYMKEKHGEEKPRFIENADESPTNNSLNLEKERTLEGVDVHNRSAFKGDNSDGKVTWGLRGIFAAIFLAALYTGSQVILYFTGGSLGFIEEDLKLSRGSAWLPTANILAIAAVCPYAGYLQDLFGKRYIALIGSLCICIGTVLMATTHSFAQALAGMAISGVGAAIGELTGLAGLAEVVPVKYRGYSLALVTAFVIPFCPYLMYVELWSHNSSVGWRWGPWCALTYNGITGLGLFFTYFPHNHTRAEGFSHRAILKRIDYVGGVLSITGLTLFLVALQSGGYTHPWKSAYVLCTLLIGLALIGVWVSYEWKGARHPMVPGELFKGQRIVGLAYVIAFAAGMNFFSILNFFPITFSSVYDPTPVQIGLKGLPPAFATTFGAIGFNAALSTFPSRSREILLVALFIMTAFGGSLAASTPDNPKLTVALGTLAAFGVGGVLVPAATVAMIVTPDALITTAAALSLSIRTVGGSIGYSIYYNIFATKLGQKLPVYVAEYAIEAGLPVSSAKLFVGTFLTEPEKLAAIEGVTPAVVAAATKGTQWAYSQSLKYVWFTSIAFGAMAIVCCILLPSTKKYQTNRVAVQM
ncbi:putative major facilitator superfamily transporter [Lindgomyces ingoldianus]|uniref:Major facilitator superfamily transporter n=1 Tax=Lindgomyces ingoldianus TaxID=673940 RepID=A0ACB6QNN7_9PLEO|nr:putative major facilitator superfamily transporter [Lindgomyces ingoldianus]KAF2468594.1 putative major facilitator superfamily transporter [Lindgomyces ingoldianus]